MPMTLFGSPVTTGLFASGGNAPGTPCPCAPWQLEQLLAKTGAPAPLVAEPPAAVPGRVAASAGAAASTLDSGGDAGAAACLIIVVICPYAVSAMMPTMTTVVIQSNPEREAKLRPLLRSSHGIKSTTTRKSVGPTIVAISSVPIVNGPR